MLRSEETIRKHVGEIMKLHDKMADLKSYFDGHGAMSPERLGGMIPTLPTCVAVNNTPHYPRSPKSSKENG